MDDDRLERLTEGQRACLRMVLRHMSSKDIARALDISPHTVDQRLKLAMKTLGVGSRVEAARLFAAAEGEPPHQTLVHQSPDIASLPPAPSLAAFAGRAGQHDRLRRTAWIVAIIAGLAIVFAALFTGLNALSEFTR